MTSDGTLRLLLIHDQIDEANRLVSLLRNASYKVVTRHVDNEDMLAALLQDNPWDLLLAQHDNKKITPKTIFHHIRRLNQDLPVILLNDTHDIAMLLSGLRLGAINVVCAEDDQHLLLVVSQALYNLENRRQQRYWKRRYKESGERCDQLLQSSRDAIAIVQEGSYIFANDSFASLLGYSNGDEMCCLPVIDTIATEDQKHFREILKPFSKDDLFESRTMEFTGVCRNGLPIDIRATVSKEEYQGEAALQMLVRHQDFDFIDQEISPAAEGVGEKGAVTTIHMHRMLDHISAALRRAEQNHRNSALAYIQVDQFDSIKKELGFQKTEDLIVKLGLFLADLVQGYTIGRFKEDAFLLLMPETNADAALNFSRNLCQKTADHVVEINNETYHLTLSIGIGIVSEFITTVEHCINNCLSAIASLKEKSTDSEVGNDAELYEMEYKPSPGTPGADVEDYGRRLLKNEDFEILFQPLATLHGKLGEFYELMIRIKPEAQDRNFPEDFISQVFKTSVSHEIDKWVLLESLKVLARKQNTRPKTRLFVNISAPTFCSDQFIPWLKMALKATNVSPNTLAVQMREIDVGRHLNQAIATANALKQLNSHVGITHFGLSLDPMHLIRRLTVDYVKLDHQLVENLQKPDHGIEAIGDLLELLHEENQKIIVPFIESAAMIPSLWQHGIHYIQGYYVHPPSPKMDYDFTNES